MIDTESIPPVGGSLFLLGCGVGPPGICGGWGRLHGYLSDLSGREGGGHTPNKKQLNSSCYHSSPLEGNPPIRASAYVVPANKNSRSAKHPYEQDAERAYLVPKDLQLIR